MISNELVHACIVGLYYEEIKGIDPSMAEPVFLCAVRIYGEQRGHRMALRALKDGCDLNYGTYMEYGEWAPSKMSVESGIQNQSTVEQWTPDYRLRITSCPWYRQFVQQGAQEAGKLYCGVLDASIARGFNPLLKYEVEKTLHEGSCCMHVVHNSGVLEGEEHKKHMEYVQPWSYHCAHLLRVFDEVVESVWPDCAKSMKEHVLAQLCVRYGDALVEELKVYKKTDFNRTE